MAAQVSAGARRFVLASALFFLAWALATLGQLPHRSLVTLALYGFILMMVFGKAYALIPSYFDRQLTIPWAPQIHAPFAILGAGLLAVAPLQAIPQSIAQAGSLLWLAGVVIFLGTIGLTIRDNLTGRETGTSAANAARRPVDRTANAFILIALAYLAVGSYEMAASYTVLPPIFDGYLPRTTHLLAAGTAVLLVFAVGFRLLPRFLVTHPSKRLLWLVLPSGAIAPVILAAALPTGPWFLVGALIESVAVTGFAAAYIDLFVRSDRTRVGFYGPLAGVGFGLLGVGLGVWFAVATVSPELTTLHFRVNLAGFVGLTIIGIAFQFYPPNVSSLPGIGNRTAVIVLATITIGLLVETIAVVLPASYVLASGLVESLGHLLVVVGAFLYVAVIGALFYERYW